MSYGEGVVLPSGGGSEGPTGISNPGEVVTYGSFITELENSRSDDERTDTDSHGTGMAGLIAGPGKRNGVVTEHSDWRRESKSSPFEGPPEPPTSPQMPSSSTSS